VSQQHVNEQAAEEKEDNPEEEMEEGAGRSTTIYVKSLNFRTNEEDLHIVFEQQGRVRAFKIPQKVATMAQGNKEVQSMSIGYCFVEMESSSLVPLALRPKRRRTPQNCW
jgi:RNA recognition motif-containing protein